MHHVPPKNHSNTKISKFHREIKILMRKWKKLRKMSSTQSNTQLIKIEHAICDSHFKNKLNEESIPVAKIKSDPKSDIGSILNPPTQLLVNEMLEICSLLFDQFKSVFTFHNTNMIVLLLIPI